VHISFVRYVVVRSCPIHLLIISNSSTNLDSWQLVQLRTMKVGGNASATDFFNKHGGSAFLSDSDVKKKYTSRIADLYKDELAKRVKEDSTKCVFSLYVVSCSLTIFISPPALSVTFSRSSCCAM